MKYEHMTMETIQPMNNMFDCTKALNMTGHGAYEPEEHTVLQVFQMVFCLLQIVILRINSFMP